MKILGKDSCLILLCSLLATSVWAQTAPAPQERAAAAELASKIHTPDDPGILRETQLSVDINSRTGLVWWIPFEFWVDSGLKNGTPSETTRKNLIALQDYTIVGILLAKVSTLGTFDYVTPRRPAEEDLRSRFGRTRLHRHRRRNRRRQEPRGNYETDARQCDGSCRRKFCHALFSHQRERRKNHH